MELQARSSLHNINCTSKALSGSIEAAWNADGTLALDPAPKMHLEVPVDSLASGNNALDKQMREIVGSRSFPNIVADLVELQADGKPQNYAAKGRIEMRGTGKTFTGTLTILREGESVTVSGETTIDMRDFGIKPPRLLVFSVQPDVAIRLHLVADPA